MLTNLIEKAETKAGSQRLLSDKFKVDYRRLCDYKAGRRTPDDSLIGELAEYVGMNPIETILQCKLETDKEKATLWQKWLKNVVRSEGLEPTPQASETTKRTLKQKLAYFSQRIAISRIIQMRVTHCTSYITMA